MSRSPARPWPFTLYAVGLAGVPTEAMTDRELFYRLYFRAGVLVAQDGEGMSGFPAATSYLSLASSYRDGWREGVALS